MIPSNEIRIGNHVFRKTYDIGMHKIIIKEGDFHNSPNLFPIPLTSEILNTFGFGSHNRIVSFADSGYDPKTFYYILEGRDEFNQPKYRHGFLIGQFNDGFYYQANQRRNKGRKLEYLHQLQNLYYALTGEELTIKEAV